ncbi:MAG: carboxypeptidase-like regulatory domain-containing protein [Rhizobiaceae bacterium]
MNRLVALAAAALACTLATASALAGDVSGRAIDENGQPLAGVNVEVVYVTYSADDIMGYGESIKVETKTAPDGSYSADLSHVPPGEYYAHAYEVMMNGGRQFNIDLLPDDAATFASTSRTVRNFTAGIIEFSEKYPYGNAGVFVLNNTIDDQTDLAAAVVRLENVESGRVLERRVRSSGEGLVATGIPFATYRVTVTLGDRPLQLSLRGPGLDQSFGASVTHDFTMGWPGNQMVVEARP